MNATRLLEFLEQPANLYQLSYQELKSLCLSHPQSATLQYLLYEKSRLDSHQDEQRNLQRLAVLVPSREALFELVQRQSAVEPIAEEDILELIPLDQQLAAKEEVALPVEAVVPPVSHSATFTATVAEEPVVEEVPDIPEATIVATPEPTPESPPVPAYQPDPDLLMMGSTMLGFLAAPKKKKKAKAKKRKKTFTSWLEQNQEGGVQDKMRQLMESKRLEEQKIAAKLKKKAEARHLKRLGKIDPKLAAAQAFKEKKRKDDMPEVARRSIEQRDTVASETLAKLLERQGNTEAAISMYEKLSLRFPQKSTYFAAKIDELKSNLP